QHEQETTPMSQPHRIDDNPEIQRLVKEVMAAKSVRHLFRPIDPNNPPPPDNSGPSSFAHFFDGNDRAPRDPSEPPLFPGLAEHLRREQAQRAASGVAREMNGPPPEDRGPKTYSPAARGVAPETPRPPPEPTPEPTPPPKPKTEPPTEEEELPRGFF